MQTKDYSVTLDMIRTLPFRPFEVVEGDTGNILHVTLLNNGDAMDLSACAIQIAYASSSGFAMQDETSGIVKTVATGTFDVTLLPAAYGAGNVCADVQIYSGEQSETLVTSTRFDFRCRKSLISGDIIRANMAYPPLIEAARVANEAAAAAVAAAARDAARDGADEPVVLLSPACASFDQFPNFEARGRAFAEVVRGIVPQQTGQEIA